MRNIGQLPRTVEQENRVKENKKRKKYQYDKAFSVHNSFICTTEKLTEFNLKKLNSFVINEQSIKKNPLLFILAIELIKSHLNIAHLLYFQQSIGEYYNKYPVRYHRPQEMAAYSNLIAISPTESKIKVPDSVRSVTYIDYVMLPVLKPFIKNNKFKKLKKLITDAWFKDVLFNKIKQEIWMYKDYKQQINKINQLLDNIQNDFLGTKKNLEKSKKVQDFIIKQLIEHHWISFLAVNSCDLVTPTSDPAYDAKYYTEPFVSRDNYLMALGLYQRIKEFSKISLMPKIVYQFKQYFNFFDKLYGMSDKSLKFYEKPKKRYWQSMSQAQKLQKYMRCLLDNKDKC